MNRITTWRVQTETRYVFEHTGMTWSSSSSSTATHSYCRCFMVRQTAWNSRQLLIYCYPRHMAAKAPWLSRHLSPSIAMYSATS